MIAQGLTSGRRHAPSLVSPLTPHPCPRKEKSPLVHSIETSNSKSAPKCVRTGRIWKGPIFNRLDDLRSTKRLPPTVPGLQNVVSAKRGSSNRDWMSADALEARDEHLRSTNDTAGGGFSMLRQCSSPAPDATR